MQDVTTFHNDLARDGANLHETTLTLQNVDARQFGRLARHPVDGAVYAQPLYLHGVTIDGAAHNVVYVATEHDSVYAFDADGHTGAAPLWHALLCDPAHGVTPVPAADARSPLLGREMGITATPVIDRGAGVLYVLTRTRAHGRYGVSYEQELHALDVASGHEMLGGPVPIHASVPGHGAGSRGGQIPFDPLKENDRPGLLLVDGVVYLSFASPDDIEPYHGWIMGYDARTLKQVSVRCLSPNGSAAGVWESGDAPAADGSGIYVATGNGAYDPVSGDFGESALRLAIATLRPLAWYTPPSYALLTRTDMDFGGGGITLLPDSTGTPAHRHLLLLGTKTGDLLLFDRDHLGHGLDGRPVYRIKGNNHNGLYATGAYYDGAIYACRRGEQLVRYAVRNGRLVAASRSAMTFGYPGATPSISADGDRNAIVWVVERRPAAGLRAFDARNLAHELYSSASAADRLGEPPHFPVPTIADGHVFVGTMDALVVYGEKQRSPD